MGCLGKFLVDLSMDRGSGVVLLRHLRHVPPPPDGVATLVNSLQNRVKSITLCVILNAKNGK